MVKSVIIDEVHLTVRVPADLPSVRAAAVRRTLTCAAFMGQLRRAIRTLVRAYSPLVTVSVTVGR
jgi:hypothetical protein